MEVLIVLILIVYLSVALIAIAFLILVIYLSKTLTSLEITLDSVANTLSDLEKQFDGVTSETTMLLHTTNYLASDIQQKAENLNRVVDAVKGVGTESGKFNRSIQTVTTTINSRLKKIRIKWHKLYNGVILCLI